MLMILLGEIPREPQAELNTNLQNKSVLHMKSLSVTFHERCFCCNNDPARILGEIQMCYRYLNKLEPNTTGSSQKRIHQNWIIEHK